MNILRCENNISVRIYIRCNTCACTNITTDNSSITYVLYPFRNFLCSKIFATTKCATHSHYRFTVSTICTCGCIQTLKSVSRKPILPSAEELEQNPRSRSAKLRVAERV